jgi:hypothetical protein
MQRDTSSSFPLSIPRIDPFHHFPIYRPLAMLAWRSTTCFASLRIRDGQKSREETVEEAGPLSASTSNGSIT